MSSFDPRLLKDPRALRNAFGTYMTGVTVVTTEDDSGAPLGFTANSFASVSLEPPLVLVCLANSSGNYDAFAKASKFAVNILSEAQIDVSNTFARPVEDRFAEVDWKIGPQGSPILDGVSAWFDCAMFNVVEAGDHVILIGEVKAFDHNIAPGLGYARGAYVTPAAEIEALSSRTDLVVSALIESNGKVLLCEDGSARLGLPTSTDVKGGAGAAVAALIAEAGVSAEIGFVYSVYEDGDDGNQHIVFLCHAAEATPAKGAFIEISDQTLSNIADPAVATMLKRFTEESLMGSFGVYYGNAVTGEVKSIADKDKQS